jgi:hypothetical protein
MLLNRGIRFSAGTGRVRSAIPGNRRVNLVQPRYLTKIFHQQNETETCTFASDQIGKHYVFVPNFNSGTSGAELPQTGFGGSKQLVHIIEPLEFTRLVKPDGQNPYAQAIVYQSGKAFNATKTQKNPEGTNYISTFFSR